MLSQRWIQRCGILSFMLSLGACGGLPKGGGSAPSTAMKGNGGTALAAAVRLRVAAHPGQSGLHALPDGRDALAARLALSDAAQRSLDVQYFIWNKDLAGKVLLEHLFRSADRGVRVRLLLDDLGTMPSDATLLAIDSHPNIEVRMFNPVALRSPRLLGMIADLVRINKRMHNKSFTADGQVAIVGGRNIGDEYFGANEAMNYADLDVVVIGPVVREVSDEFDLYWNHQEGTFHFFTGWSGGPRIDWILASSHFQTIDAGIDRTRGPCGYPSDHFPVTARLRTRTQKM
jgi:cardiolipin synthase C